MIVFTCLHKNGKGSGSKLDDFPLLGLCRFHVFSPVYSHWSGEILQLDDESYEQQIRSRNRRSPLKQIRLHTGQGVHAALIGGQCVCAYIYIYVCVCLTVHMWICLGKGSKWTRGTLLWIMGVSVIQCPLCLLPPLPDWGFQFSREAGVKRSMKSETRPHLPLFSPCPPSCETKYARTLMISVYLL